MTNYRQTGFGADVKGKRTPYKKHMGKYVFIKTVNSDGIFGRYSGVSEDGNMILNPHQNFNYENLVYENFLCEDDLEIKPEIVGMIRPTTLRNIENMIRYINRLEKFEEAKRRKDFKGNNPELGSYHLF